MQSSSQSLISHPLISRRRWLQGVAAVAGLALLAACGGSKSTPPEQDKVTKLELGCNGDVLAFDQTSLTAPAGASVELTFNNRSNSHQHNWVLVNGGDDVATAAYEAALAAGVKNDWLPPDSPQILVHTPLLDSGKSFTIAFQAPAQAGQYTYLCTFPGHYLVGMKGILTVT